VEYVIRRLALMVNGMADETKVSRRAGSAFGMESANRRRLLVSRDLELRGLIPPRLPRPMRTCLFRPSNPRTSRLPYSVEDRARHATSASFRDDERSATNRGSISFTWGRPSSSFVRDGMGHVLSGLDHVVFSLLALAPAGRPLVRRGGVLARPRRALVETIPARVIKVVTRLHARFTRLTLGLSFFGLIDAAFTSGSRWG